MQKVYLWLGSNLGHSQQYISQAVRYISLLGRLQHLSPLYQSKALGWKKQNDYKNCVIALQTELSPHDLLRAVKKIEQKIGRKRSYRRGPRTIDIDILLYDTLSIQHPTLTIPHRHFLHRPFVFIPLHDIISTQSIYYEQIDKVYQSYMQDTPFPNEDISPMCIVI